MAPAQKSELRRFGLAVGGVFLALAGISRWRGHVIAPAVLATVGVLLVVPGIVAPAILGPVRHYWMRGAMAIGEVNSRILLTILFFTVVMPVGLFRRRYDPLDRAWERDRDSYWVRRPKVVRDRRWYERQF